MGAIETIQLFLKWFNFLQAFTTVFHCLQRFSTVFTLFYKVFLSLFFCYHKWLLLWQSSGGRIVNHTRVYNCLSTVLQVILSDNKCFTSVYSCFTTVLQVFTTFFHYFTKVRFCLPFLFGCHKWLLLWQCSAWKIVNHTSVYNCFSTILQVFTTVFLLFSSV